MPVAVVAELNVPVTFDVDDEPEVVIENARSVIGKDPLTLNWACVEQPPLDTLTLIVTLTTAWFSTRKENGCPVDEVPLHAPV